MSKTNGKTTEPVLIPQPHGGALLSGGEPGHKGGGGRPPSEIRARMRGSLAERIKIAEEIADADDSSDSDRLRALDFLAKYGLGTKQEITGKDDEPLIPIEAGQARERIVGRLARFMPKG